MRLSACAPCVPISSDSQRSCMSATPLFAIAPLGAGKGAAALAAAAELIRDGERRQVLVIAPKLVATNVWPAEIASWPHLAHLRVAAAALRSGGRYSPPPASAK